MKFSIALFCSGFLAIVMAVTACSETSPAPQQKVTVGAEVLLRDHLEELEGRKVGLVMNPTARIAGTHVLDTLLSENVNIQALYAPEHGFRGDYGAGEQITDGIDQESGLPVFSLYGKTRKPTPEMLEHVDLLIFDMQDVGARFYTYISTMGLILEAAAENDVEVWILDRPNPAGGDYVSGWVLEPEHASFVGSFPIPVAHGMTLGEMATMAVGEGWLDTDKKVNYRVIANENLTRSMIWPDTGLEWVAPSPNLPTFQHSIVYLGTCFFEGTSLSEGRGTDDPFLNIGSPTLQIDQEHLTSLGDRYGAKLTAIDFMTKSIPGVAARPKHQDSKSYGAKITLSNYRDFDPVAFGVEMLRDFLNADSASETKSYLYLLAGTERIDEYLNSDDPESPNVLWKEEVEAFKQQREPYLLY
ncbi:MAG: DUF1343 domain-containing protein [Balneolales bacterium]